MKRISFFLALLFTLSAVSISNAQISKGKEFWFSFLQNYQGGVTENRVYITSELPTTGVISSPLQNWSQTFTVAPGVSTMVLVPGSIAENTDVDLVGPRALHVVTDECVSVFIHSFQEATSDGAVIFPVNSLGNDYFANSWSDPNFNNGEPELSVVATEGPTQVSITLPVSTQGHTAGVPYIISLDTGQVYQLKSDNGDITGTRITSTDGKNFAVFGGHVCANVLCVACDHLCEQMFPIVTWGKEYVTIPLATRPYDVYRVLAATNGTTYTVNGGPATTLNAGQYTDIQLSAVSTIQANNPVSVAQYSIGVQCAPVSPDETGDPFMIMLSPTSQSIREVTFNAFPGSAPTMQHYMNVVAKTFDLGTVTLDGVNIGSNFTQVPGNPVFSTIQMPITQADHTLKANLGLQISIYGYDWYESFGYSAGIRVQVPFLSIYDSTLAYCPDDSVYIALGVSDTSRIIYSEWDMGDGSPHLRDTFSFWHVYHDYGRYPVKFIYELLGSCAKDTLVIDTIKILGPEPSLHGPYNLCVPTNITITPTYRFEPDSIFISYGNTTIATTDTDLVVNMYAYQDSVIYIRVKSDICEGFDTAYIYVGHDTAGFTIANACEGLPVTFTNTSRTVPGSTYNWFWDYGDGTTSIASNTVHTHQYAVAGTYTVKMRISSPNGCSDSITHTLTITAQPHADFTAIPVCNDSVFTPVNNSTISSGTINYQWYFGDNTPANTSANPSHTYSLSGGYNVTLITSSLACSDTVTNPVNINIGEVMAFTAPSVCWGNVSTFTDASSSTSGSAILGYRWEFGDGNGASGQQVVNNYASSGVYTVKLVHDYGFNCVDSIQKQYYVNPNPITDFTVADVCNAATVNPVNNTTVTPAATLNYSWLFGDNTAAQTGNAPSHSYALSGDYVIELIATTDSACADTATQPVEVIRGATIAFDAPPVCQGLSTTFTNQTTNPYNSTIVSYQWDFGDGSAFVNTQNATHTYTAAGVYNAELLLFYSSNCVDSLTKQVTVYDNAIAAFTVPDLCNDSVVHPVNSSTFSVSYIWNFADGTAVVTGNAPAHTYNQSGQYAVELVAVGAGNCNDTIVNNVRVIIGTNINFTTPSLCEGAVSVFTNQTTNPYNTTINTYNWDFGDGSTASAQNTTHTYAAANTYSVELKLDYGNNCLDSLTKTVTVNPNPVAAFTIADVCNDSVVTVVNTSTGAVSYSWLFGDGSAVVTGTNPPHTYTQTGVYTVGVLATSSAGCLDTVSNPVNVIIGTSISFNAPAVCETAPNIFTDQTTNPYATTINGYAWDFGDAGTALTQNATHTYAAAGTYNVELKLDYGSSCLDSLTKQVVVHENPVPDFTSTIPCNGTAVQYTDASASVDAITAYNWQFGDGNTAAIQNPAHVFTTFGTFNTQLRISTVNGCIDSITKPINVLEVGTAQFAVQPVCIGEISEFNSTIDSANYPVTSYAWTIDGTQAGGSQTTYTYAVVGTHAVTLVAEFSNGCNDTATGNAVVNALPVMSAAITDVSCFGDSDGSVIMTPVSGQPSFNYAWSTNPVNTPNNTNVPAGTYGLVVTDGNECTMAGSYIVNEPTAIVVDTASSPISCYGYSDGGITLLPSGATAPYTYIWSNGQTGMNLHGIPSGTYSVTITDAENCSVSTELTLDDPLLFSIVNTEGVEVNLGETVTLTADYENGNPVQWLWSPADNMTCPECQTTDVLTYNNMTYTVMAITDLGCIDTALVRVLVDPKRVMFVPNGFTPNGDGANDYFEVFGNKEAWKQFEVQVFNRIGEKVYESNEMNFKWDGSYKGVVQQPGVYVYVVKIVYLDNFTDKQYKGSVTLIR